MSAFNSNARAVPNLRYVAIDLPLDLSDPRDCPRVERLCHYVLDSYEVGRRAEVELQRNALGGKVCFKALKGVYPRASPQHDPLLVVTYSGHYGSAVCEGRQQEVILRIGRV